MKRKAITILWLFLQFIMALAVFGLLYIILILGYVAGIPM